MNIVLTGFMGTGKSSVGKMLAKNLGWQFYDTDEIIEKEVGLKVQEIFARKGEPFFRDAETQGIKLICYLDNVVIACGGGVVLRSENMDELEKNGIIICLTAAPETILERTKTETTRPLLSVKNPIEKINELIDKRKQYYQRCKFTIDTSNLSIKDVVKQIVLVMSKL